MLRAGDLIYWQYWSRSPYWSSSSKTDQESFIGGRVHSDIFQIDVLKFAFVLVDGWEKRRNYLRRCRFVQGDSSHSEFLLSQPRRDMSVHFKTLCSSFDLRRFRGDAGHRGQVRHETTLCN